MKSTRIDDAASACQSAMLEALRHACPALAPAEMEDVVRAARTLAQEQAARDAEFAPQGGWPKWFVNTALQDGLDRAYGQLLVHYLDQKFPSLRREDRNDIIRFVLQKEVVERLQEDVDFSPPRDWHAWLVCIANHETINFIRAQKRRPSFQPLDFEPMDSAATPSQILSAIAKPERRVRSLSEVLQEYCRQCEEDARPKHQTKRWEEREVFERSLRGQKNADIAGQMRLDAQRAFDLLHDAREAIRRIIGAADAEGSLFGTAIFALRGNGRRGRGRSPKLDPQTLDLLRELLDETGAMCPSPEALEKFEECPDFVGAHAIAYHVRQAVWQFPADPQEPDDRKQEEDGDRDVGRAEIESENQDPGCPRCQAHLEFAASARSTTT